MRVTVFGKISVFIVSLFILLTFSTQTTWAAAYFAAPTGTPAGTGAKNSPWDLATALSKSTVVQPGDVLWLRGGTYGSGGGTQYSSTLQGTAPLPIIIRQYPGERAVVDGSIKAWSPAAYNWFWGFEITNSATYRNVDATQLRPYGLELHSNQGHKAINLIIHNVGHPGIAFWSAVGDGGELHGNIVWGNGVYDMGTAPGTPENPWTRGSGFYMQNQNGTRYVTDNIVFRNFTVGIKPYTEGGYADGFSLQGNVAFDNGDFNIFSTGRTNPQRRLEVSENMTYRAANDTRGSVRLGYNSDQGDVNLHNNYFVGGTHVDGVLFIRKYKEGLRVVGNYLIGSAVLIQARNPLAIPAEWVSNFYFGLENKFRYGDTIYDWTNWLSVTGFDVSSTFQQSFPTQNKVFVRANKYQSGRGHVVVYNWENKNSESVDLSSLVNVGEQFEVRDAQNVFSVIKSENYDGNPVELPLNLTAVAPVTGTTHIPNQHTDAKFNVFLVTVPNRELKDPSGSLIFIDPRDPNEIPSPSPTPVDPNSCAEDINEDGIVDLEDYSIFVRNFGLSSTQVIDARADINKDQIVDISDYSLIVNLFLETCSQ